MTKHRQHLRLTEYPALKDPPIDSRSTRSRKKRSRVKLISICHRNPEQFHLMGTHIPASPGLVKGTPCWSVFPAVLGPT